MRFKKNTYHVLSKKFVFDFKTKTLKNLKDLITIAIVGMGGSILGANAIYDFLKHKIKKKVTFFDNLDKEKLNKFKKKIILKIVFLLLSLNLEIQLKQYQI